MEQVNNESEAIQLCKEYGCDVSFKKNSGSTPEHVVVSLNAWTRVAGKDFVEAVNRLVDVYNTAPVNREKLNWWSDQQQYYLY